MQVQRLSYGVKGFVRLHDYAIRWSRMVTDKAKRKARILAFWQKHGLEATVEAFGVKRRTLYLWKSQQKKGSGSLEALNEKSKRPRCVRALRVANRGHLPDSSASRRTPESRPGQSGGAPCSEPTALRSPAPAGTHGRQDHCRCPRQDEDLPD